MGDKLSCRSPKIPHKSHHWALPVARNVSLSFPFPGWELVSCHVHALVRLGFLPSLANFFFYSLLTYSSLCAALLLRSGLRFPLIWPLFLDNHLHQLCGQVLSILLPVRCVSIRILICREWSIKNQYPIKWSRATMFYGQWSSKTSV